MKSMIMGAFRWNLVSFLCFWVAITGRETQETAPCVVQASEASFNCSLKNLTKVPAQIWDNVTMLDLSQNRLNLTDPKNLRALGRFQQLVLLNLSGNYLPVLKKDTFTCLLELRILDLSGCQLTDIKPGALQDFPRLQKLLLGSDRVHDSSFTRVPSKSFKRVRSVLKFQIVSEEHMNKGFLERVQRKLREDEKNTTLNATSTNSQEANGWPYLVAALGTTVAISVFIVLLVKCKLFQRYLASYHHALLSETDTASQCDPAALEVGFSGHGLASREASPTIPSGLDDDDGFIEDNYIQASERERAEREVEEEEIEDDDIQFSIG